MPAYDAAWDDEVPLLPPHRWLPPSAADAAAVPHTEPPCVAATDAVPSSDGPTHEQGPILEDIPAYAEDWEVADGWGLGLGFDEFDP
jgi:hypothetical protein